MTARSSALRSIVWMPRIVESLSPGYPGECRQTDADPETGCMEFEIHKGRFSFRLTAPYSEERRNAASKAAKKHSGNLTHPIQKDVL